MNVYTNKELKSKDYIFLFFLYYMGEKKELLLKNQSSKTDPRLNKIFSKKPLKNQSLKTDPKLDRLLKRPKIPAPQPPTTPRRKPFKRRENGPLSQMEEKLKGLAEFGKKLKNDDKKKRTKKALDSAKQTNRNSWGGRVPPNKLKF